MPAVPSNNVATGQVSVTSGGVVVVPARADRKRVTIVNNGATAVYLGNSAAVSTANGVLLAGVIGQALTFETAAAIYGVVASTAQTVSYIEEFA